MTRSHRGLWILTAITAVAMLTATWLALVGAPPATGLTVNETYAQRIIYFHVPSAWISMVAFLVTMLGSIGYLLTSKRKWDNLAVSSAELGIVFTLAAMASGAIWAKPAWNVWWTWDPRLTTYTVMFLLYVGYFMLRSAMDDPARRARFAAVFGIFAFLSVPITFMSIRWWRTIHPGAAGCGELRAFGGDAPGLLLRPHRLHAALRDAVGAPGAAGRDAGRCGRAEGTGRVRVMTDCAS